MRDYVCILIMQIADFVVLHIYLIRNTYFLAYLQSSTFHILCSCFYLFSKICSSCAYYFQSKNYFTFRCNVYGTESGCGSYIPKNVGKNTCVQNLWLMGIPISDEQDCYYMIPEYRKKHCFTYVFYHLNICSLYFICTYK